MKIREAQSADAAAIGRLVHALLSELAPPGPDGVGTLALDMGEITDRARRLFEGEARVWALLAEADDGAAGDGAALGVLMLNECAAIYAGGAFGEITELYVAPEHRASGLGAGLIAAAADFARARGWPRLEVGAPDQPRWSRTVAFYRRNGFEEVGPRLRRLL